MRRILIALTILLAGAAPRLATAKGTHPAADSATIAVGKPAPNFTLVDENGKKWTLKNFKGKKNVVLAFYVKDFTSG